jgi:chorismate mutase
MDISDWRQRINEIDSKLVELLNERAKAAQQIGQLKQQTHMAIHEPQREKEVLEKVRQQNRGPLPDRDILLVFERIIDVMRKLQREQLQIQAKAAVQPGGTEWEAETNE